MNHINGPSLRDFESAPFIFCSFLSQHKKANKTQISMIYNGWFCIITFMTISTISSSVGFCPSILKIYPTDRLGIWSKPCNRIFCYKDIFLQFLSWFRRSRKQLWYKLGNDAPFEIWKRFQGFKKVAKFPLKRSWC